MTLDGFIAPGIPTPVFWMFIGAAVLIQGISKSGFAGGAGILALPLALLVMPVDKVAATMLPLLILCDMNAIYHHRRNREWRHIRALYGPAAIGIVLGAIVWWWVGREGISHYGIWLKRFVGIVAVVFAFYIFCKERALSWIQRFTPGRGMTWLAGLTAGFSSTIAHAAGPIVSLYMYTFGMEKSLFVGTVAWTFTLINLTKLPFYVSVGLVKTDVLVFDLFLIPLIPIGSFLGKWMHHRVSESLFNRVLLVLVLLTAVQLISNFNVIHWVLAQFFG